MAKRKMAKKTAKKNTSTREYLNLFLLLGFVLAFSGALNAYIQSSYLSEFIAEKHIGLVFTFGYLMAFFAVNNFAVFVNWARVFRAAISVLAVLTAALFFLGFTKSAFLAVAVFLVYLVFLDLTWIILDLYLEHFSRDRMTGRIRGMYWTFVNFAWLISPTIAGFFLNWFSYGFLFVVSAVLALAAIAVFFSKLKNLEFDHFVKPRFGQALGEIMRHKNLKRIFVIAFLLQVFYCAMIIYAPLYLHNYIGFSWSQIGLLFTAMLINFVVWTYPAGWLADRYFGEKEIMSLGIFIMGVFTIMVGLIPTKDFWLWMLVLFFTRMGASWTDIMRDTYFFKQIDAHQSSVINLFRNTTAAAYVITPIIAAAVLYFSSFHYFFIIIGLIVLSGLFFSLRLRDTK